MSSENGNPPDNNDPFLPFPGGNLGGRIKQELEKDTQAYTEIALGTASLFFQATLWYARRRISYLLDRRNRPQTVQEISKRRGKRP